MELDSITVAHCTADLAPHRGVQRLLHRPPHHPLEVGLDPLIVNRGDIVQRTRCIVGHGGFLLLVWLLSQFSQIRGRLIAVGTLITERPSHRSERAQLRHSTPTLDV